MTPRILKKLCKRPAPLVIELIPYLKDDQFNYNGKEEFNHFGFVKIDDKHLSRHWVSPTEHRYFFPLKNTIGFSRMQGYMEPEWEDDSADSLLHGSILEHFTTYDYNDSLEYKCSITINSPKDVFALAEKIIKERMFETSTAI